MQVEKTKRKDLVLALEVRPRVVGFAIIEPPARLLDWGRRKHNVAPEKLLRIATKRIVRLLELYQPSVVVIRARVVRSANARARIAEIIRVTRRETTKRFIPVQTIHTSAISQVFSLDERRAKHRRATRIAGWFPELSWKLPPERKAWKNEHHRMVIFDAIATGLAFLNKSPPEGE